jgi:hypothetical protein
MQQLINESRSINKLIANKGEIMNMSVSAAQLQRAIINHRQGKRVRTFALVEIKSRKGLSNGLMYNLSRDGMYVVSKTIPNLHDSIGICLSSYKDQDTYAVIPVMVIHRSKYGFGVLFRELDSNAREVVKSYLGVNGR